jgi:hypothetical protein
VLEMVVSVLNHQKVVAYDVVTIWLLVDGIKEH